MSELKTETTTKKPEISKKEITEISKELKDLLNNINTESLANSTTKKSGFYNKENVCKRYELSEVNKDNMKVARRKARTEQLNLSKSVLSAYKTGLNQKESLQALYNFYFVVLIDLNNFSNISEKENKSSFDIVHTAHKILLSQLNLVDLK